MSESYSISEMILEFKGGSQEAANELWKRCFERLTQHARRKLGEYQVRLVTEDDIVVDVFDSAWRGAQKGRFPKLDDRDDLWQVLFMLTRNKVIDTLRRRQPEATESALHAPGQSVSDQLGICLQPDGTPTPEFEAASAEEMERLLGLLDEKLRNFALLKLAGFTAKQIGAQLDFAERSVERGLSRIRETWRRHGYGP